MDGQIRAGLIKDMVDSGAILRRDAVDELIEHAVAAYGARPRAAPCDKIGDYIPRPRQPTVKEKARRAAERLYTPGEVVVDTKGVEYACCNDGSLRLAGGHPRLKKKQRTKLRRMLKEGA